MSKTKAVTVSKKSKEIAPVQPFGVNPEVLIAQAITQNVPVETMERLLAMRRELKAEWAKEQYDLSMAKFQSECPIIKKSKNVLDNDNRLLYKYAPLDVIVGQTKDLIQQNNFSYAIKSETKDKSVVSTCVIKHSAGHSEEYPFEVPLGNKTKAMNDTQVVSAALTFAKRNAFCNAFGILTGDEDVDGKPKNSDLKTPVKTPIEELEIRAIKKIEEAKTSSEAIKVDEYVQSKKEFSKEFKEKIKQLASARVDVIDNGN